jgi:Domain of unknown function (DUF3399)
MYIASLLNVQKARLARLHQTKLAARKALVDGKQRIESWQKSGLLKTPDDGDNTVAMQSDFSSRLTKKDIFEIQHYHLLNCLERTTVCDSENRWPII